VVPGQVGGGGEHGSTTRGFGLVLWGGGAVGCDSCRRGTRAIRGQRPAGEASWERVWGGQESAQVAGQKHSEGCGPIARGLGRRQPHRRRAGACPGFVSGQGGGRKSGDGAPGASQPLAIETQSKEGCHRGGV